MYKHNWLVVLGWRALLFAVVAWVAARVPFRSFLLYVGLENLSVDQSLLARILFPWANFDGIHYLQIAGQGYIDQARFLPLLPLLIAVVSWGGTVSTGQVVLALCITNACFVAALWQLKRLLELDYNPAMVERMLAYLLVFPASFFFVSVYTESLFLLLSVVVLYASRRHRWRLAILAAMLLSVTRLTGVLSIVPIAIEYVLTIPPGKRSWTALASAWWLALPIVPLLGYSYYNWLRWGDPLQFVHGHGVLANGRAVDTVISPLRALFRYVKIVLTVSPRLYEFWLAIVEVVATAGSGYLIWKSYQLRVRGSYVAFATLLWMVPVLSGTFSGMPRYVGLLLPIHLSLALATPKRYVPASLLALLVLQLVAVSLFARGYLIG